MTYRQKEVIWTQRDTMTECLRLFSVGEQEAILAFMDGVTPRGTCLDRLVLGGGCFQNAFLLEGLAGMAQSRRCQLALPQRVPCNDGGISLGQVAAVVRQWKG